VTKEEHIASEKRANEAEKRADRSEIRVDELEGRQERTDDKLTYLYLSVCASHSEHHQGWQACVCPCHTH
jgi:hypothetical protein